MSEIDQLQRHRFKLRNLQAKRDDFVADAGLFAHGLGVKRAEVMPKELVAEPVKDDVVDLYQQQVSVGRLDVDQSRPNKVTGGQSISAKVSGAIFAI